MSVHCEVRMAGLQLSGTLFADRLHIEIMMMACSPWKMKWCPKNTNYKGRCTHFYPYQLPVVHVPFLCFMDNMIYDSRLRCTKAPHGIFSKTLGSASYLVGVTNMN
jgi:hypothetical protein